MPRRFLPRLRATLLTLLVVAALPATLAVLHSGWTSRRESVEAAAREALEDAFAAAQPLGTAITEARQVLLRLAEMPEVLRGDTAACNELVKALVPLHPTFRDIGAIHPDGAVFCSAIGLAGQPRLGDAPWFKEALGSRGLLLRLLPSGPVLKRRALAGLYAVRDTGGRLIAVLFVTFRLREVAGVAFEQALPPGSSVTLLDRRGTIIAREPEGDAFVGRPVTSQSLWRLASAPTAEGPREIADLDGKPRLFGVARIPDGRGRPEAYLAIGVPAGAALEKPTAHFVLELAGLALAVLLALAVTWFGLEAFVLRPVGALVHAARELAAGRLGARSSRVGSRGARELEHLSEAFDDMAETLERSLSDTSHALDVLRDGQSRLQSLSRSVLEGQEAERSQLARELHDEVGQALTAATLNLDALRESVTDAESSRRVKGALDVVKHALAQVRDLSLDLRPSILDDLGLVPALRWYLGRQSEKAAIPMELAAPGTDGRLPRPIETACFRIAQEAVTNALRHAGARHIEVAVEQRDRRVELCVRDDGVGFEVEPARQRAHRGGSFGLVSMEERAALLGGRLELASRPGAGTEVHASIPIEPEERLGAAA